MALSTSSIRSCCPAHKLSPGLARCCASCSRQPVFNGTEAKFTRETQHTVLMESSYSRRPVTGPCPACQRDVDLTFHHLIPRKVHRRARFKKNFTRESLNQGIYLCRACHSGIHKRYDEMTLATHYASWDAISSDPDLQRHFAWVAKQRLTKRART